MRKPGARKAAYSGVSNPDERSATAPDRAAELHRQLVEARIVSNGRSVERVPRYDIDKRALDRSRELL